MMCKIGMVAVIYNKSCEHAPTCLAIRDFDIAPDFVVIVDNSTIPNENEAYCAQMGWSYLSMHGNAGLSKAYNAALPVLQDKVDIVVWADDDTRFPKDFLTRIAAHISANPNAAVFLPLVKTETFIMSPCIYTPEKIQAIRSLADLEGQEISGINSGLTVRMSVYQDYRYDETIFLDYLDHDFLRCCRQRGLVLLPMEDVVLQQSYFAESKPPLKAFRFRDEIYCKDYKRYQKKGGKPGWKICKELFIHRFFQIYRFVRSRFN